MYKITETVSSLAGTVTNNYKFDGAMELFKFVIFYMDRHLQVWEKRLYDNGTLPEVTVSNLLTEGLTLGHCLDKRVLKVEKW